MRKKYKEEFWLIYFEDDDVPFEIFTDEKAARHRYSQCLESWACHLFVRVNEENNEEEI